MAETIEQNELAAEKSFCEIESGSSELPKALIDTVSIKLPAQPEELFENSVFKK